MASLREWLRGSGWNRGLRHERISEAVGSIHRPHKVRPALPHPLTVLALGLVVSLVTVVLLLPEEGDTASVVLGTLLFTGVVNFLVFAWFVQFRRDILRSRAKVGLVCLLALLVLVLARLSVHIETWPRAFIPVTGATLVLAVVFDRRFALEVSWILLLYVAAILFRGPGATAGGVLRVLLMLSAGMLTAALTTGRIRTRGRIIQVGLWIGLVQLLVTAAIFLAWGGPPGPDREGRILEALFWALAHGILVGFVISGSLPLVEYLFGISTDVSLLELANISQQTVLRNLLVAAPGTYNHSFIVGMLAEEAAEAIGANPLLARAGGYYHDIGKMVKAEYFGENEAIPGSHHRRLSPMMSALIIRAHVKDGVELARHHDLPRPILDIIEQHHGTTVVEYFLNEARKRAGKGERIEESTFRYPGPRPRTKEAGVVMLADSVEAATRSLSDPSPARVESTIRGISAKKLGDGQLDDCGLTLKEVRTIEDSFVRVLAGIFHQRPRYHEPPADDDHARQ